MIRVNKFLKNPFVQLGLGVFPLLLALGYFFIKVQLIEQQTQRIVYLQKKKYWKEKSQEEEKKVLSQLKIADKEYVENHLETLTFLQSEVQHLQALVHSNCQQPALRQRLHTLQNLNKIQFAEEHFQRVGNIQETQLLQTHPVEINAEDLKELLSRIENIGAKSLDLQLHPPQFIIKNFHLTKKTLSESSEIYIIKLDLIKREMINE